MDQKEIERALAMMASSNDTDAVMGLRAVQGILRVGGVDMARALAFALVNGGAAIRNMADDKIVDQAPAAAVATAPRGEVTVSGMPQCHEVKPGTIEMVVPGNNSGELVALPGAAASDSADIALHMKDALVAAVINKSRFKLKLIDTKNARGEIVETVLQAEYDRAGMVAIRIWANVRGEAAALATVLRRAVANGFPDLVAA